MKTYLRNCNGKLKKKPAKANEESHSNSVCESEVSGATVEEIPRDMHWKTDTTQESKDMKNICEIRPPAMPQSYTLPSEEKKELSQTSLPTEVTNPRRSSINILPTFRKAWSNSSNKKNLIKRDNKQRIPETCENTSEQQFTSNIQTNGKDGGVENQFESSEHREKTLQQWVQDELQMRDVRTPLDSSKTLKRSQRHRAKSEKGFGRISQTSECRNFVTSELPDALVHPQMFISVSSPPKEYFNVHLPERLRLIRSLHKERRLLKDSLCQLEKCRSHFQCRLEKINDHLSLPLDTFLSQLDQKRPPTSMTQSWHEEFLCNRRGVDTISTHKLRHKKRIATNQYNSCDVNQFIVLTGEHLQQMQIRMELACNALLSVYTILNNPKAFGRFVEVDDIKELCSIATLERKIDILTQDVEEWRARASRLEIEKFYLQEYCLPPQTRLPIQTSVKTRRKSKDSFWCGSLHHSALSTSSYYKDNSSKCSTDI